MLVFFFCLHVFQRNVFIHNGIDTRNLEKHVL